MDNERQLSHLNSMRNDSSQLGGVLKKKFSLDTVTECMQLIKNRCEDLFPKYFDTGYKIREAVQVNELEISFFLCRSSNIGKYSFSKYEKNNRIETLHIPEKYLSKLAVNERTQKLYISTNTEEIVEVDIKTFNDFKIIQSKEPSISFIFCDSVGNFLYAISMRGILKINLNPGHYKEEIIFQGKFSAFKFSQKEWLLGYTDGKIERIDKNGKKFETKLQKEATKLKYARNGKTVLAISGKSVLVFNLDLTNEKKHTFDFEPTQVFMSKDEKTISVSLSNGKLIIIDNQAKNSQIPIPIHTKSISTFYLSSHNEELRTYSMDSRIATLTFPVSSRGFKFECKALSYVYNPNKKEIIYIENHSVKAIDIFTHNIKKIYESQNISKALDFNKEKSLLAFVDHDEITVLDRETLNKVKIIKLEKKISISSVYFDRDGDHIFSISDENTFIYCNSLKSEKIYKLKGHESKITAKIWIDGRNMKQRGTKNLIRNMLATGSKDCKIIIWDFKNEKSHCKFSGHTGHITSLALTRNENKIISGSRDGTIKVWALSSKELLVSLDTGYEIHSLKVDRSNSLLSFLSNKKKSFSKDTDDIGFADMGNTDYNKNTDNRVMIYWNLTNYTEIMSTEMIYDTKEFLLGEDSLIFLRGNEDMMILEYPVLGEDFAVIGPKMDDKYEYIYYIYNILCSENVEYNPKWDNWVVFPFRFNTMIFYAFANFNRHLKASLERVFPRFPVPSLKGDPYSISTTKNCDKFLKVLLNSTKTYLEKNSHSLSFITQDTIIQLNLQGKNYLHNFYDQILFKTDKKDFPRFASSKRLPIIILSPTINPIAERFFPELLQNDEPIKNSSKTDENSDSLIEQLIRSKTIAPSDDVMEKDTTKVAISIYTSAIRLELSDGTPGSIEFLKSLLKCRNTKIFKTKYIQYLLNRKWERMKKFQFLQAFLYFIFLIGFCVHLLFILNTEYEWAGKILIGFLAILLFIYDILQLYQNFRLFWSDFWNYFDIMRIFLTMFYCFYPFDSEVYRNEFISFLALVSFIRGILFFKLFNETRYLVQLIQNVMIDMRSFSIVLTYSIFSFTMIQVIRDKNLSFKEHLINSFLATTGNLRVEPEDTFNWFLTILMLIFNLIILMNMLISIMSYTFIKVSQNSEIADYIQIASMVLEIESMIKPSQDSKGNKFLQICDIEESYDSEDQLAKNIKAIKTELKDQRKRGATLK